MKFSRVDEVVRWRLCMGCGACVAACPEANISMVDIVDQGLRAKVNSASCQGCGRCVDVCPGVKLSHQPFNGDTIQVLREEWGPVLEVWEGYAADEEIRLKGSSGGVSTALALFGIEHRQASSVLQTGYEPDKPLVNASVLSKTREELLHCSGSRYSPAAPCTKLNLVGQTDQPFIFIGKPCDVAAMRLFAGVEPGVAANLKLAISIFCAGTPATKGTLALLDRLNVRPNEVQELRYRGLGWPGATTVSVKGTHSEVRQLDYEQSWGEILSKYGQVRCRLCPDSTGEFADIACGDPWYRDFGPDDPGWSLVLVRTRHGRMFLQDAMKAGYVQLQRVDPAVLPLSQAALLQRKRHLWGRLKVMRMMRVPIPRYTGFSLFRNWTRLSVRGKLRSLFGTLKRVVSRGWTRPYQPQWPYEKSGAEVPRGSLG